MASDSLCNLYVPHVITSVDLGKKMWAAHISYAVTKYQTIFMSDFFHLVFGEGAGQLRYIFTSMVFLTHLCFFMINSLHQIHSQNRCHPARHIVIASDSP